VKQSSTLTSTSTGQETLKKAIKMVEGWGKIRLPGQAKLEFSVEKC
jgi:hypothetical protein